MNRTERLYAIVEELRRVSPGGRSSNWLARRFEVSARTIKRDMSALMEAGTPIFAEDGRGGGYRLSRAAALPPLSFTAEEATAIAIAIAAEPALPFLPEAHTALARVLGAMTPEQRTRARALAARIWMRNGPDARGPAARLLDDALQEKRVANIDYLDGEGQLTHRAIEPLAFARTRNHWHVLAWCRMRKDGRWFRIDRIQRVSLTREQAPDRDLSAVFGPPPADARPIDLELTGG